MIVEPVVGNMGCVPPQPGYLEALREITAREGALLIFDEVMTGFRVAFGGASELYNIKPDLTTLGKIIGGGLPVGAYGGPAKIMEMVAPLGPVYQAGTLCGNPLAMAAGIATLCQLKANREKSTGSSMRGGQAGGRRDAAAKEAGVAMTANRVGSMFTFFFTDKQSPTGRARPPATPRSLAASTAPCWTPVCGCRRRNLKPRSSAWRTPRAISTTRLPRHERRWTLV